MPIIFSIDVGNKNMGLCLFDTDDPDASEFSTIPISQKRSVPLDELSTELYELLSNTCKEWIDACDYMVVEQQISTQMLTIQHCIKMYAKSIQKPCVFAYPQNVKAHHNVPIATGSHRDNKRFMKNKVEEILREKYPNLFQKYRSAVTSTDGKTDDYADATAQALYAHDVLQTIPHVDRVHIDKSKQTKKSVERTSMSRKRSREKGETSVDPCFDTTGIVVKLKKLRYQRQPMRDKSGKLQTIAETVLGTEELLSLPLDGNKTRRRRSNYEDFNIRQEHILWKYAIKRLEFTNTLLEAGVSESIIRLITNSAMHHKLSQRFLYPSAAYLDPRHPLTAQLFKNRIIEGVRVRREGAIAIARRWLAMCKALTKQVTKTCKSINNTRDELFTAYRQNIQIIEETLNLRQIHKAVTNLQKDQYTTDAVKIIVDKLTNIVKHQSNDQQTTRLVQECSRIVNKQVDKIKELHADHAVNMRALGIHEDLLLKQLSHTVDKPTDINQQIPSHLLARALTKAEIKAAKKEAQMSETPQFKWPMLDRNTPASKLYKEKSPIKNGYLTALISRHHRESPSLQFCQILTYHLIDAGRAKSEYNIPPPPGQERQTKPNPRSNKPGKLCDPKKYYGTKGSETQKVTIDVRPLYNYDYFYHGEEEIKATHEEIFSAALGRTFKDPYNFPCHEEPLDFDPELTPFYDDSPPKKEKQQPQPQQQQQQQPSSEALWYDKRKGQIQEEKEKDVFQPLKPNDDDKINVEF